ncbi:MAG TPA: MarC family protein [Aestuariivirgaceae bacterium]|jgi:multiple antibiotic resistance protein
MHWSEYTRFSISLFVLVAPFLHVPLMLSLVGDTNRQLILQTATVATLTALAILLAAHFFGELLLTALGASLPSFQIGGGLIVLLIGLSLVQGKLDTESRQAAEGNDSPLPFRVGVTPLGTPALAGAASITAVILETHEEHGLRDDMAIALIILLNAVAVWAVLACAPAVGRFLGRNGLLVLQRVFGIVIVAIGVEIMMAGFGSHWSKLA